MAIPVPAFQLVACEPEFSFWKKTVDLELPEKRENQTLFFGKGDSLPLPWEPVRAGAKYTCSQGERCWFALVMHSPFRWRCRLPGRITAGPEGISHDFHVEAEAIIDDLPAFLAGQSGEQSRLTVEDLVARLNAALVPVLDEAVREQEKSFTPTRLIEEKVMERSGKWLERQLAPVFRRFGCALAGEARCGWRSEEMLRRTELRRREEQQRFEAAQKEIENQKYLDERERAHQREEQKRRHMARLTAIDREQEEERLKQALQKAEYERRIAEERRDAEAARRAADEVAELERERESSRERFDVLQKAVADINSNFESLMGRVAGMADQMDKNAREFQKAEWLQQLGCRPEDMRHLGIDAFRQSFLAKIADKERTGGDVRMYMPGLRSRDLGCIREKKTLAIGAALNFRIHSNRAGRLTVLNIGTSGNIWLNVPNFYAPDAAIAADQTLDMPGPGVLPLDDMDYVEMGPAGWERMVALVTPRPLLDPNLVRRRSTPDAPLIRLNREELLEIERQLSTLPPESWGAAALTFLVGA